MNQWDVDKLISESSAYWRSFTLQVGVELDIFTILDETSLPAREVARISGGDCRGLERLLNALVAMGLLEKEMDYFSNTEFSVEYLSATSPNYMGHIIKHHKNLAAPWIELGETIRAGGELEHTIAPDSRESFLMGMFNLGSKLGPLIADRIDLSDKRRLFDLGGGPGAYSIAFCHRYDELSATVFDLPHTEEFANKVFEQLEVEERIEFLPGDYLTDELPRDFDVAWLSHILHGEPPENAHSIICKAANSLVPGGELYIHEFILNDDECSPLYPALFSINMYLGGVGGRSYKEQTLRAYLEDAGLSEIELIDLGEDVSSRILKGTKR